MSDGLLYRFLPNAYGELEKVVVCRPLRYGVIRASTPVTSGAGGWSPASRCRSSGSTWRDVESPDDDLRQRGFEAGAARFARGEGIWYGDQEIFIACTDGGEARKGQIWRYRPSALEGSVAESDQPATLELFIEPNDGTMIENADNLTVAPWGRHHHL